MSSDETPDFAGMHQRFWAFPNGVQAAMRRVATPGELRDTPGLYQLFPSATPTPTQVRLAFLLPWCPEFEGGESLGQLLADQVSEGRVIQIARADDHSGLLLLRQVVRQLDRKVRWKDLAPRLYRWSKTQKRRLVEGYYLALHNLDKGA